MRFPALSLKSGIFSSTVGVFGSAFLWLLSFKAVAYWMGPEGLGLFSQLRQMAQAATVGATFGGTNSVVQGLAERREEGDRLQFRANAFRLMGATGAILVLAMLALAPQLTQFFLSADAPVLVATVRWLAVAVLLNVCATYALAVLNGYRAYAYLALAQIAGPAALVLLLVGGWWMGWTPDPRLLAVSFVVCFGLTCMIGVLGVSRLPAQSGVASRARLPASERRAFLRFALSNLGVALSTTAALLLIRSWVIDAEGLAFAGLFDAGWTLTFNYTTLFLTACSAIYLPMLTAATRPEAQKTCMLKTAYLVFGTGTLICYAMVLFRDPLINLLYSPLFQPSGQVVSILVLAVLFRGVSWVYGILALATRQSRVLLLSDLALNLLLLALTRCALDQFGSLEALSWAFVVPNFLYLVFSVEYVRRRNPLMRRRLIWPLVAAGTVPLFYLALVPETGQLAHSGLAVGVCVAMGIATAAAALLAYRKVAL